MSQENLETVRSTWGAWGRGETSEALSHTDKDLVVARVAPMPYHGTEGLVKVLTHWVEGFDEFEMTPEERAEALKAVGLEE